MNRLDNALEFASKISEKNRVTRTIYILKCNEYYKVGYASIFKQRLHLYKVHNPYPVSVVATNDTTDYKSFEDYIFKRYNDKLHHGEWFTLSEEDLRCVLSKWF